MSKKAIEWSELLVSLKFKKDFKGIIRPQIVSAQHGCLGETEDLNFNELIVALNKYGLLNECCSQSNRI